MSRVNRRLSLAAVLAAAAVSVAACGPSAVGSSSAKSTVNLVGFSTPKSANNAVEQAFEKTSAGKGVTFKESYGASGDQSRAVAGGLKADLVHFSLTPDVTRLVDAGLVAKDWADGANKGLLTDTAVVLVVRKGNPKHITGWDDLVKPGIGVVTPNPGSSGSARWNILAAWEHVIAKGGSTDDAKKFIAKLLANTKALPSSGRDATTAFESGTGDVLISYESEAIYARQHGAKIDYILPSDTLLIQNPAALTKKANAKAKAFLTFALSAKGQETYASLGFRPLPTTTGVTVPTVKGANDPSDPFPTPKTLWTIDKDFGGWSKVNTEFFDENNGIITKLLAASGKS